RARRKALHMQQKELADQLGVTPSAICKWESDSTCPDITLLLPLARALGITVDELLSYDETRPDASGQPSPVAGNEGALQDVPPASLCAPVFLQKRHLRQPADLVPACPDMKRETAAAADKAAEIKPLAGVIATPKNSHIFIWTFGYFEIYVDGHAIPFTHAKSKEFLALLVDRRGGYLTAQEAITYLWENETVNKTTLSRCRKVAMRMNETLKEYGIDDIVKAKRGIRCLDISKVSCDLYDYLSGRSPQLYQGTYMLNYSWAEYTIAELDRERRRRQ
ncbi:MAG: helix-turn-helix domain-containing protein, partial [Chordicoccus sp.]